MEVQVENKKEVDDQTLLLVTGQKKKHEKTDASSVKQLAHALIKTIENHGEAKLKCVGAAAVNRAIKAVIVANLDEEAKKKICTPEHDLVCVPEFGTAKFQNGEVEKTAIILKVYVPVSGATA